MYRVLRKSDLKFKDFFMYAVETKNIYLQTCSTTVVVRLFCQGGRGWYDWFFNIIIYTLIND